MNNVISKHHHIASEHEILMEVNFANLVKGASVANILPS